MRRKAKLIITSAVVAALTVAGLSVAAGGSGGGGGSDSSTAAPGPPPAFTANSDVKRNVHRPATSPVTLPTRTCAPCWRTSARRSPSRLPKSRAR